MDLHAPPLARAPHATRSWSAAAAVAPHSGLLEGATLIGEVCRRNLSVRVGVWLDEAGAIRRVRWRAADVTALAPYAEAACSLLEAGVDARQLDAAALRRAVPARTPADAESADLVAVALETALLARGAALVE